VGRGYSSCSEKKPTGKNCVSTSGFAVVSASISPAIGPSALLSPISIVLSALLIAAPLSTAPAPGRPLTCGCSPRRWPWPCRPGAAGGPGCPHRLAPPPRHPSGWQPSKHAAQETGEQLRETTTRAGFKCTGEDQDVTTGPSEEHPTHLGPSFCKSNGESELMNCRNVLLSRSDTLLRTQALLRSGPEVWPVPQAFLYILRIFFLHWTYYRNLSDSKAKRGARPSIG
jgi:hypothetical protein